MSKQETEEKEPAYREHDFFVHRYVDDTPLALREHSDTLGRYESYGSAVDALDTRKRPELLRIEERTEYLVVEDGEADTEAQDPVQVP